METDGPCFIPIRCVEGCMGMMAPRTGSVHRAMLQSSASRAPASSKCTHNDVLWPALPTSMYLWTNMFHSSKRRSPKDYHRDGCILRYQDRCEYRPRTMEEKDEGIGPCWAHAISKLVADDNLTPFNHSLSGAGRANQWHLLPAWISSCAMMFYRDYKPAEEMIEWWARWQCKQVRDAFDSEKFLTTPCDQHRVSTLSIMWFVY